MEPMEPLPTDSNSAGSARHGELILQNSRHSGMRRALTLPMTLVGQATGCDIRLNVETVQPLHCVLLPTPTGVILRDLGSESGTFVNDERITTCLLRQGDLLRIGPFEFQVALPDEFPGTGEPQPVLRTSERDALRIQAAAVVAQQAALTDEEIRLQQRRVALEKQEQQLASHLEEKQRGLVEMQEQLRQDRLQLHQERAGLEQVKAEIASQQEHLNQSLRAELDGARLARARLVEFRRRLRRRWKRHWSIQEAAIHQREEKVNQERERLRQERGALNQACLRFNGEAELRRRELDAKEEGLRTEQARWHEQQRREAAALSEQRVQLEDRAAEVARQERWYQEQLREAEEKRARLTREITGLENRVRHLREHMGDLMQAHSVEWSAGSAGSSAPLATRVPETLLGATFEGKDLTALESLAGALADQRLHLVEQWETLLRAQQAWHEQQIALVPELEQAAQQLQERETRVRQREQQLERFQADLLQQQQVNGAIHTQLEGWQTRLTAWSSSWQAERAAWLLRLQTREAVVERRQGILDRLRQRWAERRRLEREQLDGERMRCREIQRQYIALWEECQQRKHDLQEGQRTLAERNLALQQLQLEIVGRAPDSAAAEKRLERLRRQWSAFQSRSEKARTELRRALANEAARLQIQADDLVHRMQLLDQREEETHREYTLWDQSRAQAEQVQRQHEAELDRLRASQQLQDRQIAELRDEVERVVRLMLDEVPSATVAA